MPSAVIKIAIAWIVFNALNERVYETTKGDFVHCERLLRAGPALEGTACGEGKWCRYTVCPRSLDPFYVVYIGSRLLGHTVDQTSLLFLL